MRVVRSAEPSARLVGVDLRRVRAADGVADAFAASDVLRYMKPIESPIHPVPARLGRLHQKPLAVDRIRYVGQPIAVVVAQSPQAAVDAAGLVDAVVEPAEFEAEAPIDVEMSAVGDIAEALQTADVIVSERFTVPRQLAMPIEPRGLLVDYDEPAGLRIWSAMKVPAAHRALLSSTLEIPPEQIHHHRIDIGGGFGMRGEPHPEDLLVAIAAVRLARPVLWVEERDEHFIAAYQGRGMSCTATIALDAAAHLLALDAMIDCDIGGYLGPTAWVPAWVAVRHLAGPYRVPAYRCRTRYLRSPKPPTAPLRAPGFLETTFVRERLLDLAASKLGLDVVEVRRRNLLQPEDLPYDTRIPYVGADTMVYDEGDYPGVLDHVLAAIGATERSHGRTRRGFGVSCDIEGTGAGLEEPARARLEAGRVRIAVGTTSFGQGHETTLAEVAADALGVTADVVEILESDSDVVPLGGGTFGSRSTVMAGNAVSLAAHRLREAITARGSELLGVPVEMFGHRIQAVDGSISLALDQLGDIELEVVYRSPGEAFVFGACAANVEVDPELGAVRLLDLVVAADAGVVLNQLLAEGQLAGGAALGAGAALLEEVRHADDGTPLTTGLHDYVIPTARDLPDIRALALELVPTSRNALGVRGLGEIAVSCAAAAIANAVAAATDGAVPIVSLPLRPLLLASVP
jgi:CO/xanthine dehydrogenase Mo-binding subunit